MLTVSVCERKCSYREDFEEIFVVDPVGYNGRVSRNEEALCMEGGKENGRWT